MLTHIKYHTHIIVICKFIGRLSYPTLYIFQSFFFCLLVSVFYSIHVYVYAYVSCTRIYIYTCTSILIYILAYIHSTIYIIYLVHYAICCDFIYFPLSTILNLLVNLSPPHIYYERNTDRPYYILSRTHIF